MSGFLSAWLNVETEEIVCADTISHTKTQKHMGWSGKDLTCWREWTWTGPSEYDLAVRVPLDDAHGCNWYRAIILARYGGDWMRAVADCGRQAVRRTGVFRCPGNQAIEVIPDLPGCRELYCPYCPELCELPELPECQILECDYCDALCSLPKELPECRELICSFSNELRSLPNLPKCQKLECWNCDKLNELPEVLSDDCEVTW